MSSPGGEPKEMYGESNSYPGFLRAIERGGSVPEEDLPVGPEHYQPTVGG